jgi:hypothetical protein
MAEKSGKKKTKKAAKASADPSVLGNLRTTRPTRLGGDRRTTTPRAAAAKTSAATKPASATMSSGAAKSTRATASAAAAKSSAAKSSAAKPKAAKPKAAAPKAPRPPATPPAGWQTPDQDGRRGGPPSGTEIVTTAVQAAGELAQIGIAAGGRMLKRAAGRIPRP